MNIEETINNIVDRVLNEELSKKVEEAVDAVSEASYEEADHEEMGEEEVDEGNAFSGARAEAIKNGEKEFTVDGETYPVEDEEDEIKESKKNVVTLSESEMIELIQRLVMEQKEAKGLKDTEKTLKDSKKVNDEAMKEVNKKMKDYVKAGSNEGYEENPEGFPKGNGEMGEDLSMKYHASDAVEEYIDQIARSGGMENLDYDAIKPDEDWIEMNILGDSKTGNSSEYANAVKTDANEKVNDRRKKNWLSKLKKQSYKKAVQPVEEFSGKKKSDKDAMSPDEVMSALSEGTEDKSQKKINEDIHRMKSLLGHNYKTQ